MDRNWAKDIKALSSYLSQLRARIPQVRDQDLLAFEEQLNQLDLANCPEDVRQSLKKEIDELFQQVSQTLRQIEQASKDLTGSMHDLEQHKKAAQAYTKAFHAK